MASSSPSWSSSAPPSSRVQASPSPMPAWSSSPSPSSEDLVPLSRRRIVSRAPVRGCLVAAGPLPRARAESPEGAASTLTSQELANIRARYGISSSVRLFLPTPDDRVTSTHPRRIALCEAFLKRGLRLPLHPFLINLFDLFPVQLVPNSVRTIYGFLVLCHLHGIKPKVFLFRSFYTLRQQSSWWVLQPRLNQALWLGLPTFVKGWKT